MNRINFVLIGIVIILGSALVIVSLEYIKTQSSYESLLHEKLQKEELIQTFKEKYSQYKITEYPDSKGIPYKYHADSGYGVELLFGKDRIVLKAWNNDGVQCIVSNPFPRDILDNCPLKW